MTLFVSRTIWRPRALAMAAALSSMPACGLTLDDVPIAVKRVDAGRDAATPRSAADGGAPPNSPLELAAGSPATLPTAFPPDLLAPTNDAAPSGDAPFDDGPLRNDAGARDAGPAHDGSTPDGGVHPGTPSLLFAPLAPVCAPAKV